MSFFDRLRSRLTGGASVETPDGPPTRDDRVRRRVVVCVLSVMAVSSLTLSLVELDRTDPASLVRLFDGREYVSLATNLLDGSGYRITDGTTFVSDDPTAYRTPGYPLLLAFLGAVFGLGHLVTVMVLIQAVVLAGVPAVFFFLSQRLGLGLGTALGAAAAAFFFFPLRYLSMLIQPELVALVLLLVAIERLLAHLQTGSRSSVVVFAVLLSSAVLFKQNLVVVLIIFVFPLFRWLERRAWVVATAVVVLMIGPWVARNLIVIGSPVMSTNGGINFYLGCNPEVPVSLDGLAEHGQVIREIMDEGRTELEADRELYRLGRQILQTRGFGEIARRLFAKIKVMARDYFPFIQNEVFFLVLPIMLAWGRVTPLVLLIAVQLVVGFVIHPVEVSPRGLVYANLVDIVALKVFGGLALYYFSRERQRGFQLLLLLYFLILLPSVVFIPVDRITYMADSLLIPAFVASPMMVRSLWSRLIDSLRKGR